MGKADSYRPSSATTVGAARSELRRDCWRTRHSGTACFRSLRRLGIPGLDRFVGTGVFYGAAGVEAPAMAGQEVYVIGGANLGRSGGTASGEVRQPGYVAGPWAVAVRRHVRTGEVEVYEVDALPVPRVVPGAARGETTRLRPSLHSVSDRLFLITILVYDSAALPPTTHLGARRRFICVGRP